MGEIIEINIVNSIAVFLASVIPIYLSFHLEGKLQKLTIILSVFALVHGIYHTAEVLEYEEIAEDIINPLSVVFLIIFGFWYLRIRRTKVITND